MNSQQIAYQVCRTLYNSFDIVTIPISVFNGVMAVQDLSSFARYKDVRDIVLGIVEVAAALYIARVGMYGVVSRKRVISDRKKTKSKPEDKPMEFAERVVIDDTHGLETLLEKTRAGGGMEWGTAFGAREERESALIYDILEPEAAKTTGLITKATPTRVNYDGEIVKRLGFTGRHHFHPNFLGNWLGGLNYAVSFQDRACCLCGIELLSFNMPYGPEVIGYNLRHTYIPADDSKRVLVRASSRDIIKYLGRRK